MADQTIWDDPTADQLLLLRGIESSCTTYNKWPDVRYLNRWLRQNSASASVRDIMDSFPIAGGSRRGFGPSYSAIWYNPNDYGHDAVVRLTLAAGLVLPSYTFSTDTYITMIQFCAKGVANASPGRGALVLESGPLLQQFGDHHVFHVAFFPEVLQYEPLGLAGSMQKDGDNWKMELGEVLAEYVGISDLKDYVTKTLKIVARETSYQPGDTTPEPASAATGHAYVSSSLIDELEGLDQSEWNVRKLLALLGELNSNYAVGHPYASLMLYRAVIDCVPPIFGCKSFAQVASSAPGITATDRSYLKVLEKHRDAADDALHRHLRKSADLIAMHYLPPGAAMDALVRIVVDKLNTH